MIPSLINGIVRAGLEFDLVSSTSSKKNIVMIFVSLCLLLSVNLIVQLWVARKVGAERLPISLDEMKRSDSREAILCSFYSFTDKAAAAYNQAQRSPPTCYSLVLYYRRVAKRDSIRGYVRQSIGWLVRLSVCNASASHDWEFSLPGTKQKKRTLY